jgi:hypothetical protein
MEAVLPPKVGRIFAEIANVMRLNAAYRGVFVIVYETVDPD